MRERPEFAWEASAEPRSGGGLGHITLGWFRSPSAVMLVP